MNCQHRPRVNKFGVKWCIDCGCLHPGSSGKPLEFYYHYSSVGKEKVFVNK